MTTSATPLVRYNCNSTQKQHPGSIHTVGCCAMEEGGQCASALACNRSTCNTRFLFPSFSFSCLGATAYFVFEKEWDCDQYPPDGEVTFYDIKMQYNNKTVCPLCFCVRVHACVCMCLCVFSSLSLSLSRFPVSLCALLMMLVSLCPLSSLPLVGCAGDSPVDHQLCGRCLQQPRPYPQQVCVLR